MLTAELLHYTRRKGVIVPRLLDPADPKLLAIAQDLMDLVAGHQGMRRGELEAALRTYGQPGLPQRVARGLAQLVLERCTFEQEGLVDPRLLRMELFDGAADAWRRDGRDTLADWRAALVNRVGQSHELTPQQVDAMLFADLPENQRLGGMERTSAEGLLFRYNSAQVQGLLLWADRVELSAEWPGPQRLRQLFRFLKFYGLLFREDPSTPEDRAGDGTLRLIIDGPASVLDTRARYGLNLAQFFPALLLWSQPWNLRATLRPKGTRREETLELRPHPFLRSHYPDTGQWVAEDVRAFVTAFNARKTDWAAAPAEELLTAPGNRILIPDFIFRHASSGRVVYVEYLPYAVPERLAQRLAVIETGGYDYLLVCRRTPALVPLAQQTSRLVLFHRNLVPGVVHKALQALQRDPSIPQPPRWTTV